jgi:hypothetical protein
MLKTLQTILLATLIACGGGSNAPKEVKTADDYKQAMTFMMDKGFSLMSGDDCAKMGADLKKFYDDNKALIDSAEAWKKANKDEEKKIEEEMMPKIMEKAGPAMAAAMKCEKDPTFKEAMKAMKM